MNELNFEVLPSDEHNRKLVSNVHPKDWQNPDPAPMYNIVAVGAGTAGLIVAAGAAGLGAKVALFERHLIGGDCLNVGCVPSKCLIRSSRVAAEIQDASRFGLTPGQVKADDFATVMERLRRIRAEISAHDSASRFSGLGVDMFLGEARFTGRNTIEVAGKQVRFKKAVVTSGARAVMPAIDGIEKTGCLTNETVFSLTQLPKRLIVIGGGPIGCELAQAFSRLGSKVTIIQRSRFLSREDPEASSLLSKVFEREGIRVILNATPIKATTSNGRKQILVKSDRGEELVEGDEILIGAGRAPNVENMGLEAAGVEYDKRKGVKVNDRLQTSNPNVFAAGDVCMAHKFTHAADAAARIVIQNALFAGRKKLSALAIPWCTYTDPEIAHVGLYGHEAKEKGIEIDTFSVEMGDIDRAVTESEGEGFIKVHVKKGTDRILGATIVSAHAGEMISELSVAMATGAGLGALGSVIHPYPTQAEAIKRVADAYTRTRLTPFVKKLFKWWLARGIR